MPDALWAASADVKELEIMTPTSLSFSVTTRGVMSSYVQYFTFFYIKCHTPIHLVSADSYKSIKTILEVLVILYG